MVQSLPLYLSLLPKPALISLVVPITEAPRRDMDPTPLIFGERGGVFLQDSQAIPPVLSVEVIPEAVPGLRCSCLPSNGSESLGCSI